MKVVDFDSSSLGGPDGNLSSAEICAMWDEGLKYVGRINHLSGDHLVEIRDDTTEVFSYATAIHSMARVANAPTREFVGTQTTH